MSTVDVRLIDECRGPQSPRRCGRCGALKSARELDRFRYLDNDDDSDRPRPLCLCEACAVRLADTDGRFHEQLQPIEDNRPYPGTLEACIGCEYLDGLECCSPLARMNGGPGIHFPDAVGTSVYVVVAGPFGRPVRVARETWSKVKACTGRRVAR